MRIRCTGLFFKRHAILLLGAAFACAGCLRVLGQCDGTATNLDGVTAPVGVNGPVNAMVEWDPDGPAGPLPNMLVVAGQFTSANGLSVPGLVGWDGKEFIDISGPDSVTYPKLLTLWDPDGPGPEFPKLVAVTDGPYPTISMFDGQNWAEVVQFGADANVTAITSWDPYGSGFPMLIFGGDNLAMGGAGPTHLLAYDGALWSDVADITSDFGPGSAVTALITWDPDGPAGSLPDSLVIGGHYTQINGKSANNVAYLVSSNGSTLSLNNLSGGVSGPVNALLDWDAGGAYNRLVIGGDFSQAGGSDGANGLVYWTDQYYGFGLPQPQITSALAVWLPDGIGQGPGYFVMSGSPYQGDKGVYYYDSSANQFQLVGGLLGTGLPVAPPVLTVWDAAGDGYQPQYLFAGGAFSSEEASQMGTPTIKPVNNIVRINTGSSWVTLPNVGLNLVQGVDAGTVSSMLYATTGPPTTEASRLYVGGGFDFAGNQEVHNFTAWTGSVWSDITAGFNGPVNCLAKLPAGTFVNRYSALYAGGDFTSSGTTAMNNVALFSGSIYTGYSWVPLGSGVNGEVLSMVNYNGLLIVGGNFNTAGGAAANAIAAWNPTNSTWSPLGLGIDGVVYALVVWDPDGTGPLPAKLIAGGSFSSAGGLPAGSLAEWDGVQWLPFDGGNVTGEYVRTLMNWPDPSNATAPRLVIGGSFTQIGGVTANNIAVWTTNGWNTSVGIGFTPDSTPNGAGNPEVMALASADLIGPNTSKPPGQGPSLIAGGYFTTTGSGDPVANLARWDSISGKWTALGSFQPLPGNNIGPITAILPLAQEPGDRPRLLLGGRLSTLDGPSDNIYNQGLVVWGDSNPYILSASPAQETNCPGTIIVLSTSASGDGLVYRWQCNGTNLFPGPSGTGSIIGDVTQPTLYITNCSAADDGSYACAVFNPCGAVTTSVSQVTVSTNGCPPLPQILTASTLPNGQVGLAYTDLFLATNGFPPYTWTLQGGALPPGLSLGLDGTLSGIPQSVGGFGFTVGLVDSEGESASQAFSLTITAPPVGILTVSPLPPGTVSNDYTFTLLATNGVPPYNWITIGGALPAGLTLATNGIISGNPTTAGTSNFTAQVSDSLGSNATAGFALTIYPAQLTITNLSPLPAGTLNYNYFLAFGAVGGAPPYLWAMPGAFVPGLSLNGQGILQGIPGATGAFGVHVQVTDSNGAVAFQSFTLNITPQQLTINPATILPSGQVGSVYSQAFQAAGGNPPYTWTQISGTLPAGLQFSPAGALSGIPTQAGAFNFMIQAQDSALQSSTEAFKLSVAPVPLSITTAALPNCIVGSNYSFALSATNGQPPYSWSLFNGVLPGGLILSNTGAISGIPTNTGVFDFSVLVSDFAGSNTSQSFVLTSVVPPVVITNVSPLAAAPALQPYSLAFGATGGEPPYFWSWAGAPPPGLFLGTNGILSGIPSTPGNFLFYVQATDQASDTSISEFELQINAWTQLSVVSNQQVRLDFVTVPGQSYSVQASDSLSDPSAWAVLTNIPPASLPAVVTLYDDLTAEARFYRVQTPAPGQ